MDTFRYVVDLQYSQATTSHLSLLGEPNMDISLHRNFGERFRFQRHAVLHRDRRLPSSPRAGRGQRVDTTPTFYVPDKVGIIADHELSILQEAVPSAAAQIDNLISNITTPHVTNDVNTMLHVHHTLAQRKQGSSWYIISLEIFGTLIVPLLLIFLLQPYCCRLITLCFAKEAPLSQTEDELPTSRHPSSTQLPHEQPHEEPARRMTTFTTYRNAEWWCKNIFPNFANDSKDMSLCYIL
jgi:hypothetical protein